MKREKRTKSPELKRQHLKTFPLLYTLQWCWLFIHSITYSLEYVQVNKWRYFLSYIFTFALSCMGGNGGSLVILPSFHENRIELNTTHRRRECREQSESRNFKYRASVKVKECVCTVLQHLRRFVTSVEREIIKIHSYRAECLLF